jgi:2'-5' RNA ligase
MFELCYNEHMQTSIVVLLDPPSYNYVRAVQLKMYELFRTKATLTLEPHFTIKYAYTPSNLKLAEDYFDDLISGTKEFDVNLNSIGSFDNDKNVVFLNVEKNDKLQALHMGILDELARRHLAQPSEFEGKDLHFHITLAYKDISKEDFQKAKLILQDEKPDFQFRVKRLAMYVRADDDAPWCIYKIGNLAAQANLSKHKS